MTQPLTREQKQWSKQKWDNGLGLVGKEFKSLEAWVIEAPNKNQDDLTKHLRLDLSDSDVKWTTEEKIEVMSGLQKSWEKKL